MRSLGSMLWLLLALVALLPARASSQESAPAAWAVVPLLGAGVTRENDSWGSAGVEAAVELEYGGQRWRGGSYGSWRGLGVGCSERCLEGGPAVGIGASRSVGGLWIGGGALAMKQSAEWQVVPFVRVSMDAQPLRLDLRIELPRSYQRGLYVPILVGFPISAGR
jgi:hypothetical protein